LQQRLPKTNNNLKLDTMQPFKLSFANLSLDKTVSPCFSPQGKGRNRTVSDVGVAIRPVDVKHQLTMPMAASQVLQPNELAKHQQESRRSELRHEDDSILPTETNFLETNDEDCVQVTRRTNFDEDDSEAEEQKQMMLTLNSELANIQTKSHDVSLEQLMHIQEQEDPQSIPPQSTVIENYRLTNYIGSGTFGKVFLCEDVTTGKYYAMKVQCKKKIDDL
jgi:hypothetical protein